MPTAPQILAVGHICLDVIPIFAPNASPQLTPGSLTRVGPALRSPGGPVANVGLALHRLGTPTALMGKVGDDLFGHEIIRLIEAHGPGLAARMIHAPDQDTSYTIVISPPTADRLFLHHPGANDTFSLSDFKLNSLDSARLIHFGYPPLMQRFSSDEGVSMRQLFEQARARHLATSLDMCAIDPASDAARVDWPRWLEHVLPVVDFFQPSFDELRFMLLGSTPPANEPPRIDELRDLAARCLAMGAAVVAIKLGEHGLYLRSTNDVARLENVPGHVLARPDAWRGRELLQPCCEVDVVGTTGSGDATIAGLLAALLRDADPGDALRAATATGACCVEAPDATTGIRPWREIERRLAERWRHKPHGLSLGKHWSAAAPHRGPADRSEA